MSHGFANSLDNNDRAILIERPSKVVSRQWWVITLWLVYTLMVRGMSSPTFNTIYTQMYGKFGIYRLSEPDIRLNSILTLLAEKSEAKIHGGQETPSD